MAATDKAKNMDITHSYLIFQNISDTYATVEMLSIYNSDIA